MEMCSEYSRNREKLKPNSGVREGNTGCFTTVARNLELGVSLWRFSCAAQGGQSSVALGNTSTGMNYRVEIQV